MLYFVAWGHDNKTVQGAIMSEETKSADTTAKAKPKAKAPTKPRAKATAKTKTTTTTRKKITRKPAVLNKQDIEEVERLAAVLTSEQVADYLCVSRRSFYNIMDRQPDVKEAYRKGRSKAAAAVGGGLLQRAIAGDTASAIFYLKTKCGWKETKTTELVGSDGGPIETKNSLSDAELNAKIETMLKDDS